MFPDKRLEIQIIKKLFSKNLKLFLLEGFAVPKTPKPFSTSKCAALMSSFTNMGISDFYFVLKNIIYSN